MNIKAAVPNSFTLGNLILGVIGIVLVFESQMLWASFCIGGALVLDFFDGFWHVL